MINIQDQSFRYIVNVDYDFNTNNCDCYPDFCRCGTIENIVINKGLYLHGAQSMMSSVDGDTLEKLLAFMFFRHCLTSEDFSVKVTHGYYGEEIDDVLLTDSGYNKVCHFNNLIISNDIRAILAMILTHHYGYVMPSVLDYKEWELKTVLVKDIEVPKAGLSKVLNVGYDHWDESEWPDFFPGCLVIPHHEKLKIIDGFHRWSAFTRNKKRRKVKVLAPVT